MQQDRFSIFWAVALPLGDGPINFTFNLPYQLGRLTFYLIQYAKPSMVQGTSASIPACPLSGKKQGHLLFLFPLRPYRLATAQ